MIPLLPPYHGFSKYYDIVFSKADYDADVRAINLILRGCGIISGKILDLGCGTGQHAIRLAKIGYEVKGVDIDPEMIKRAQLNAEREKVYIKFIVGDMRSFDSDEQFDCILCLFGSFGHLIKESDVKMLFSKVYNLLKRGGVFIFDFINRNNIRRGWKDHNFWTRNGMTLFLLDKFRIKRKEGLMFGEHVFIVIKDDRLEDLFKEKYTFKLYDKEEIARLVSESKFYIYKFCSVALQTHCLRESKERDYMIRTILIKI